MTRKGTIWLLILIIPFRVLLLLCNLKMTDFRFDHSFLHIVPPVYPDTGKAFLPHPDRLSHP